MNVTAGQYSEEALPPFSCGDPHGHCTPVFKVHNHPLQPHPTAPSWVIFIRTLPLAKKFVLEKAASMEVVVSQDIGDRMLVVAPGDRIFFRKTPNMDTDARLDTLLLHVDFDGFPTFHSAALSQQLRPPALPCAAIPNIDAALTYRPAEMPPEILELKDDNEFEEHWAVDRIVDYRGNGRARQFRTRFVGSPVDEDIWVSCSTADALHALDVWGGAPLN